MGRKSGWEWWKVDFNSTFIDCVVRGSWKGDRRRESVCFAVFPSILLMQKDKSNNESKVKISWAPNHHYDKSQQKNRRRKVERQWVGRWSRRLSEKLFVQEFAKLQSFQFWSFEWSRALFQHLRAITNFNCFLLSYLHSSSQNIFKHWFSAESLSWKTLQNGFSLFDEQITSFILSVECLTSRHQSAEMPENNLSMFAHETTTFSRSWPAFKTMINIYLQKQNLHWFEN